MREEKTKKERLAELNFFIHQCRSNLINALSEEKYEVAENCRQGQEMYEKLKEELLKEIDEES